MNARALLLPLLLCAAVRPGVAQETVAAPAPLAPPSTALTGSRVAPPAVPGASAPPVADLRCSGQAASPGSMQLQLGKSTLMRLPEPIHSRSVGNPAVVQAMLVAPDTLYLVGADIGSTNMIVQGRSGMCNVIEVTVGLDSSALQAALHTFLPEQKNVHISAAADALVLSGSVDDAATAAQVVELATAFVRRPAEALNRHKGGEAAAAPGGAPVAIGSLQGGGGMGANPRIINLLTVNSPQQVMLEVKIAEVSKTLIDNLEVGASLRLASGWTAALTSNFLSGLLHGQLDVRRSPDGNHVTIDAEKQDGLVRILAEPTVMAISGKEGSFLAGGKILIPVAQDNNKVTLEEKEFGVGLRFTPTVLAGGRINLQVAPEASELSRDGVGISVAGFNGPAVLPLITTRRASTTVQLLDGQSFAIGGLIKNNHVANVHALPVLGEVPILGALFRSTEFENDRTELLFVVTAHLVKPLPANYTLPTDSVLPPGRAELFLQGRLEGKQPEAGK